MWQALVNVGQAILPGNSACRSSPPAFRIPPANVPSSSSSCEDTHLLNRAGQRGMGCAPLPEYQPAPQLQLFPDYSKVTGRGQDRNIAEFQRAVGSSEG